MTLVIRLAGAEASSRDTASMLTEEASHLTYHRTMRVIVMV